MNQKQNLDLKYLAKPLSIAGAIVFLFVFLLYFGLNKINALLLKNNEVKQKQALLNQKITVLNSVDQTLSGDITFLDVALPRKTAAMYGLAQIKNQALLFELLALNIRTSSLTSGTNDVSRATISFEVEGSEQNIYNYLKSFAKLLPLMKINKVGINKSGESVRATVSVSVFSAELPKKIPSVTESVIDFTKEEISTLKSLAEFTLPQFIEPKPTEEFPKEDPFN